MTVTHLDTGIPASGTSRLRSTMRTRLAAATARRELRRDLASYTTPVEVGDLLAAVSGNDDAASKAIRTILLGNLRRCA